MHYAIRHRMQRISPPTPEPVADQLLVHLHVPDGRLDFSSSLNQRFEAHGNAPLSNRAQDAYDFNLYAPIAHGYDSRGVRPVGTGEDAHLLQCLVRVWPS